MQPERHNSKSRCDPNNRKEDEEGKRVGRGWDAEIGYGVRALSFELIPKFCLRLDLIPVAPIFQESTEHIYLILVSSFFQEFDCPDNVHVNCTRNLGGNTTVISKLDHVPSNISRKTITSYFILHTSCGQPRDRKSDSGIVCGPRSNRATIELVQMSLPH